MFWLLALGLALMAVGFLVAPALRLRRVAQGRRHPAILRELYRQRIRELEEEARSGLLAEGQRAEMEEELGQALLSEWREDAPKEAQNSQAVPDLNGEAQGEATQGTVRRQGIAVTPDGNDEAQGKAASLGRGAWTWLLFAAAMCLVAAALYLRIGEPQAGALQEAPTLMALDPAADRMELDRWRVFLGDRVNARPRDAGSWLLLGYAYMMGEDYAAAASAFERAHGLAADDGNIAAYWLQARFLAADGRLDAAGRELAQRILADDPAQSTALEVSALDALHRQDFRAAVAFFNRLLSNPLTPGRRRAMQAGFTLARSQLADLAPAIDVSLTAQSPPPAGATLFVLARPLGGGMPYAVVRRPASVLPLRLRLDDAVSMNPAAPLSRAQQVEVLARISLAGTASAHPGDWEWRSQPLVLTNTEAPITLQAVLRPPSG